jgi:DUF917 family protein
LEALALGAAILGTGGGGNPYIGRLRATQLLKAGFRIRVLPFDQLEDADLVVAVGGIGAPVVGIEKFEKGDECYQAMRAVERFSGKPVTALISSEIGGSNAIEPLIAAAYAGLPVVDADGMGRAFPEVQMCTYLIYGLPGAPAALADEKGNIAILSSVADEYWLEKLARTAAVDMGATAGFALAPMRGSDLKRTAVPHTLSLALKLGRLVLQARSRHLDPVSQVAGETGAQLLFEGKIQDVSRRVVKGFARGRVEIDGLRDFQRSRLTVDIQNENLVARRDGEVIASVPDLIMILDLETGEPITTELLRFGFRVAVLGLAAPEQLRTARALEVVGPRAFGYDLPYRPLGGGGWYAEH